MTPDRKQNVSDAEIVHNAETILLAGGAEVSAASLKICLSYTDQYVAADGGADRLRAAGLRPQAVVGDFDSLSAAARQDFAAVLHEAADQDQTDFEKTLRVIEARVILALGFLGGRLDHTIAALNVLVRHADRPVVLVGDAEVAFALNRAWTFDLAPGTPFALLPMAPVKVQTRGLEWDLAGQMLQPDGLVSSSNRVAQGPVHVQADGPLIITLPLAALDAAIAAVRAE